MKYFYSMNRRIQMCCKWIRNFLYIDNRFLTIIICITLIELNSLWKSFWCFSHWRHTNFRHSRNFSLSIIASVVFHVQKWTALTATKLLPPKNAKWELQWEQIIDLGTFVFDLQRKFTLEFLPTIFSQLRWSFGANKL